MKAIGAVATPVNNRDETWNLWWLVFDGFIFSFGFTFLSPSTILPVFVARLTPVDMLAGAVPAIDFVGLALPQLLGARWATRAARSGGRKRFVLVVATLGRIPMLVPILATAIYGDREPVIVLTSLLVGLGLFRLSEGIVLPAYFDIVGAVIDPRRRARYFSLQQASGAVGGVLSAVCARWLLGNLAFPWGFVACFALGTFFVSAVLVIFAQVREPEADSPVWASETAKETVEATLMQPSWWRDLVGVIAHDPNFRLLLAARALTAIASMAPAYFAVSAVRRLGATDADGATFGAVMLASSLAGTIAWGAVAGKFRHAILIPLGGLFGAFAALTAMVASDATAMLLAFACVGFGSSALGMADTALPLDLAERSGKSRALYVASYSTLTVPFAVVAPIVGGAIASLVGYGPVNGVAIASYVATMTLGLLLTRATRRRMHVTA